MGAYCRQVLADSPVLYWGLDEPSGTEANDASGKGFIGTYKGTPTLNQGASLPSGDGASVKFARASSQQVSRADNAELRGMTALTLEMWVKPTTTPAAGEFYTLFFKGPTAGHFAYGSSYTNTAGTKKLTCEVDSGTATKIAEWNQTLSTEAWTHIVFTYDGTNFRLYVNGAPHGSNPITGGVGTVYSGETNAVYLGSYHEIDYFNGGIDEAAIYRTALSQNRIEAHYKAATGTVEEVLGYPELRGTGEYKSGIGAITPPVPTGTLAGDLLIYLAESVGTESAFTVAGWNTFVEAQAKEGTRLTALFKLATTKDLTVSNDTGDHQQGRIISIKAGTFDETLIPNASGKGTQASTKAVAIPGGTSTLAKCLIVAANAGDLPDGLTTTEFSAWTNANLTELTERIDNTTAEGNGGALGAATGWLATAKAWGETTATAVTAAVRGCISAAVGPWLKPKSPYFNGASKLARVVATSAEIEKPGERGDTILVVCYLEANKVISVTGATGVGTQKYATTPNMRAATFRIVHDGLPAKLKMTWEGSESKGAAMVAVAYSGCDATTPVSTVVGWSEVAASASYSGAAVETPTENNRVVVMTMNAEGTEPSAVSNGMVTRLCYSPVVVDKHQTATGTSGTTSWTYATSIIRLISTLALQPTQGAAGQHISITNATETNAAQGVTAHKALGIVNAAVTEAAQALRAFRRFAVGNATETDAAQAVKAHKARAVTNAAETDAAQALPRHKALGITKATEADAAQALTSRRRMTITAATETDAARPFAAHKQRGITLATETDAAQALTRRKLLSITAATEADVAQVLKATKPIVKAITAAAELDTAQALAFIKPIRKAITNAAELDAAQVLSVIKPIHKALTNATELDTAQALTRHKARGITTATETDAARILTLFKKRSITPAAEADAAQALVARRRLTITPVAETDAAQALTSRRRLTITAAAETDAARPLVAAKKRSITAATETDAAQVLTFLKPIHVTLTAALEADLALALTYHKPGKFTLAAVTEIDTARPLATLKRLGITAAAESDSARALTLRKVRALVAALTTDAAQALSYHKVGKVTIVPVAEIDTARPLTRPPQRRTLTPATGTELAQPLGRRKRVSLQPATETATALVLSLTHRIALTLTPVFETDLAMALVNRAFTESGSAFTTDEPIHGAQGSSVAAGAAVSDEPLPQNGRASVQAASAQASDVPNGKAHLFESKV